MFICDKPGSIAASIAHTKSGSDIKDMLLKKLSSGGSVGSRDEGMGKTGSTAKDINKRQKERKGKSASNERVTSRKRCVSAITMRRKSPCSQGSLASSKSASSAVGTKKSLASKLKVSDRPAKDVIKVAAIKLFYCN